MLSEERIEEIAAECAKVPELDVLAEYTGKAGKRWFHQTKGV